MTDNDSPYDDPDFQNLMDEEGNHLTPEDIFSMVLLNRKRMVRVNIELRDKEGNKLDLATDVIEDLLKYIDRKLNDDERNQFADQIFPLMGKILASGLARLLGVYKTGFYLTNDDTRYSFINMMSLSFLLLKYIQQKELSIHTVEEPITEEELNNIENRAKENAEMVASSIMSTTSNKKVVRNLLDKGLLSKEELRELLDEQKDN